MNELFSDSAVISAEEALRTEIILNQALVGILLAKKIITEEELVSGIRRIREERGMPVNDWECLL